MGKLSPQITQITQILKYLALALYLPTMYRIVL